MLPNDASGRRRGFPASGKAPLKAGGLCVDSEGSQAGLQKCNQQNCKNAILCFLQTFAKFRGGEPMGEASGAGLIECNLLFLKKLMELEKKMGRGEKISDDQLQTAVALGRAAEATEEEIAFLESIVLYPNGKMN
jgi:hypothetical protein